MRRIDYPLTEKGRLISRPEIVDKVRPGSGKSEPAKGTRSDQKDAKTAIHGPLVPRRPWRGTLSSSDRVPFALSLFIADRLTLIWVRQLSAGG